MRGRRALIGLAVATFLAIAALDCWKNGALTFDGSSYIGIDAGSTNVPTWTTTLTLASLSRTGRSTLGVQLAGDRQRLRVELHD